MYTELTELLGAGTLQAQGFSQPSLGDSSFSVVSVFPERNERLVQPWLLRGEICSAELEISHLSAEKRLWWRCALGKGWC